MFNNITLMQKEIFSEPAVIKNTISTNINTVKQIATFLKKNGIKTFFTMARGTSDNAATCFSYACQKYTNYLVGKIMPSTFTIYNSKANMEKTCLLVISQSGMSDDTIDVINKAKNNGAVIISVTNNINSKAAKLSDFHLFLNVNEEKSVAATKTFVSEIVALYMLVNALCENKFDEEIYNCDKNLEKALELNKDISILSKTIKDLDKYIILSRGIMLGIGDEIGLKLTECCYLYTKSFSSASFKHGPMSLVDKDVNIILIAPKSEFDQEFISQAKFLRENNVNLIVISNNDEVLKYANYKIKTPITNNDMIDSIIYANIVSLIALNIGLSKGLNVDEPRHLNKVTITK